MKQRKAFFASFILAVLCMAVISSCNKDNNNLPLEPISIIKPDSLTVSVFPDSLVPLQFAITTDRPIDWIMCVYDIDSSISNPDYVPTYPYTLFVKNLQSLNPQVNLYTDTSSYLVPYWAVGYTQIRFKVTFQAGSATAIYGQNYPVGVVGAEKEFDLSVL